MKQSDQVANILRQRARLQDARERLRRRLHLKQNIMPGVIIENDNVPETTYVIQTIKDRKHLSPSGNAGFSCLV